jgi:prepilin-type N-terminal cleavage/methylation domain-containing protein
MREGNVVKQRRAFTLFELILVCAVLALLAAIVVPSLEVQSADSRVIAGADMVKGRLAEAQSRAVEEGRAYRFEIVDSTKCRVVPDGGGPVQGATGVPPDPEAVDTLPQKVFFGTKGSEGGPGNVGDPGAAGALKIIFLPDGSASDDAEISLSSPGARPVTLKLRALTATITAVRQAEDHRP